MDCFQVLFKFKLNTITSTKCWPQRQYRKLYSSLPVLISPKNTSLEEVKNTWCKALLTETFKSGKETLLNTSTLLVSATVAKIDCMLCLYRDSTSILRDCE